MRIGLCLCMAALMLAGCGGGGIGGAPGSSTPAAPTLYQLQTTTDAVEVVDPTVIEAGGFDVVSGRLVLCPGDLDCHVVEHEGELWHVNGTGAAWVTEGGSRTGERGVDRVLALPEGSALPASVLTIQPGGMVEKGNVAFVCPGDGIACTVRVRDDGSASYNPDGGEPATWWAGGPAFEPSYRTRGRARFWGGELGSGYGYWLRNISSGFDEDEWTYPYVHRFGHDNDDFGTTFAPVGSATYRGGMVGVIRRGVQWDGAFRMRVWGNTTIRYEDGSVDALFYGIRGNPDGKHVDLPSFRFEDVPVNARGHISRYVVEGGGLEDLVRVERAERASDDRFWGAFRGPKALLRRQGDEPREVLGTFKRADYYQGDTLHGAFGARRQDAVE